MEENIDQKEVTISPLGQRMYEEVLGKPVLSDKNRPPLIGVREFTVNHLFANVWSRSLNVSEESPGVTLYERRLITIALLAAQGRSDQLKDHVCGACRAGIEEGVLLELMIHVAHYAGWAAGASGQAIVQTVYKEEEKSQ
jgi:4-carboxymuconolactone decarboxylase